MIWCRCLVFFFALLSFLINNLSAQTNGPAEGNSGSHNKPGMTTHPDSSYNGIKFEQNLNWQEVQDKAKAENKYIFVDCYATWCVPCKKMDKEVYPNNSVGEQMNAKFISIKVQMDSSKRDDEMITNMYGTARILDEKYKINSYPTFLFFSPEGEIVHKGIGVKSAEKFILLATNATLSNQQYFVLLKSYEEGKKDYTKMPYLANQATDLGDDSLSKQIASDYIHNYLEKIDTNSLFKKENIQFVNTFYNLLKSKDKIFDLYYHSPGKVDSICGDKGSSRRYIRSIIFNEEMLPLLATAVKENRSPDWKKSTHAIQNKYERIYADYDIIKAKLRWYYYKKEWKNYAKYLVQQIEMEIAEKELPPNQYAMVYLNNNAFEVFKYSNNKKELEKALSWVNQALPINEKPIASYEDTKANLLYKLGRKKEGLALEAKAVSLDPKDQEIKRNLEKMNHRRPTWPSE
jgi:thioredoxin-related protein